MEAISRRNALGIIGGTILGGTIAATTSFAQVTSQKRFEQSGGPFSWTPHVLDAQECAPIAYDGYWENGWGCAYGAFYSIVGVMGEKHGAPYNSFPFTMLEVGKSGIADFGTICGALLGAASAMALFWGRKERNPMVAELFRWYEQTALPTYDPGSGAKGIPGKIPTSISQSVLCHISVSKWCYETGLTEKSKERSERCARITASVAIKAIEIMNAKQKGSFIAVQADPKSIADCRQCHAPGKESDIFKGVMDCTPCHSGGEHSANKFVNHP
ncbi:MAG: C-GCAxxG-C-C family protein [Desulfomicrobium apsheronum]|nr:C-GCAxxG-C-C family protein [Desulfomicrobium apsheronum]